MMQNQSRKRPRVVVLGAGFAGLTATVRLAREAVDIVVVDRHNYHLFQPLLYQVATAALSPADIAAPIRGILGKLPNVHVLLDTITDIDRQAREVHTLSGRSIDYDYLLVATGATHNYFGNDHWHDIAPGLKRIEDALELRRRILLAFERAEMEEDAERREALMTFVIVGGGPTGVEMAGAVAELTRFTLTRDFRRIKPENARVMLVDANDRILRPFPEKLSTRACKSLERMEVQLVLNSRVDGVDERCVRIGEDLIATETVIWSAGVKASPAGNWLNVETDGSGRIEVDERLHLPGDERVFIIGDVASHTNPDGTPTPGLAPAAKQQGRYAARVLAAIVGRRKPPNPFRYRDYGQLATIGRHSAVVNLRGWHITGAVGWWFWGLAHIYYLIGFRNRIVVAANWFWSYLTFGRGIRLITGDVQPSQRDSDSGRAGYTDSDMRNKGENDDD
ncbi:MAG TPA: NAD(P)/FAD-dependent oxidoreductase [Wenzhouxiangellaceae bacterium]|nr:NAD(P)/FAD-dependent oxidoreductase [Wenzhouxiangellaceae bacterium]